MDKIKTIPVNSLEEYCIRLECIAEMVLAVQSAIETGDPPRSGYSFALWGVHDDLLALLDELESLYTDSSERGLVQ